MKSGTIAVAAAGVALLIILSNATALAQENMQTMYILGVTYEKGEGVPQDYGAAIKWYTKSAEQGYAPAQYNLARMYAHGLGVPQDYPKAADLYRKGGRAR